MRLDKRNLRREKVRAKANTKSKSIIEGLKRRKLAEIFELMDGDHDGKISA